ncbi:hypothetical protein RRG08_052667 [Elysia crispata]|uniref:Uncharacterized protein n=1 Tax=Elysia crispata TaxID=231223 RepID=A0AAE1E2V8_9GAST|nr:hypothetical protein RRG08_052667 [Elysia crispata]
MFGFKEKVSHPGLPAGSVSLDFPLKLVQTLLTLNCHHSNLALVTDKKSRKNPQQILFSKPNVGSCKYSSVLDTESAAAKWLAFGGKWLG